MKYFYCFSTVLLAALIIECVSCQAYIGGAYDFGSYTHGERRGELGPAAIAGITIGAVAILMALGVTVYFCYYVTQNSSDDPHDGYYDRRSNLGYGQVPIDQKPAI